MKRQNTVGAFRKGVAETAEHDNQPAGEVHLDKHPNGQPDTRQQISNLTQGMFVGAVADNFDERIEQKIFHCEIVVDNER